MADEQAVAVEMTEVEGQQVEQAHAGATAASENTETVASTDHMIPKARFDEINNELKRLKSEAAKAQREREESERKSAEEQGEYKKLYEQMAAEKQAAEDRARALEMQALRAQVARKVGIPEALADRLRGEDEAELEADAKALMKTLPKPVAPNTNSGGGNGAMPREGISEADINELAAVYGISPEYMRQALGARS